MRPLNEEASEQEFDLGTALDNWEQEHRGTEKDSQGDSNDD